jgi:hypothetical protein
VIVAVCLLAGTALLSAHLAAFVAARRRGSREAVLMALIMDATSWWSTGRRGQPPWRRGRAGFP